MMPKDEATIHQIKAVLGAIPAFRVDEFAKQHQVSLTTVRIWAEQGCIEVKPEKHFPVLVKVEVVEDDDDF